MMKRHLFAALKCFLSISLLAQQQNPISQNDLIVLDVDYLSTKTNLTGDVGVISVDQPQLTEEELSDKNGEVFEFGKLVPVDIDFINQASKMDVVNGTIYRLAIQSDGAKALSIYYNEFNIPFGGKLLLYNTDQTQIAGPFTH